MLKRFYINKAFVSFVLALALVSLFILFWQSQRRQVLSVSSFYMSDICKQKTNSINDLLTGYISTIDTTAYFYEQFIDKNKIVDLNLLKRLENNFRFTTLMFVSKQGVAYSTTGQTLDSRDRIYLKEGLQGKHGYCYIQKEILKGYSRLAFYAPIHLGQAEQKTKIVGVIVGFLTPAIVDNLFKVSTFGYDSDYCLCALEGEHLHCFIHSTGACFAERLFNTKEVGSFSKQKMLKDLQEGKSCTYLYKEKKDFMTSFLSPLAASSWVLLQVSPSKAVNKLVKNISFPTYILAAGLALFFLLYIAYILYNYTNAKKQIGIQNKKSYYVSYGSNYLNEKFIVLDLVALSYEYLTLWQDTSIPQKGKYKELVNWLCNMQTTPEEKQQIKDMFLIDTVIKNLSKSFGHDKGYFEFLSHTKNSKKQDIWTSCSVLCVEKSFNKPTKALITMIDATHIKNQEIKDRKLIEDALKTAQLASRAKSDFLSRMSHDIRTPLNAITGMSKIALMYEKDREKVQSCVKNINRSAKHLTGLVNAVLDMSKIEHGKMTLLEEPFSLCDVTDDMLAIVLPQVQSAGLKFSMKVFDIENEYLKGDKQRLEQTLINIAGNAIKFTPKGGKITISFVETKSQIKDYAKFIITCSDTGIGMSKETLAHIFDPFYRVNDSIENKIEGTGLGMTIAKSIATMMKGNIKVQSEAGKGTKVTLVVNLKIQNTNSFDTSFMQGKNALVIGPCHKDEDAAYNALKKIGVECTHTNSFDVPDTQYSVIIVTQEKITLEIAKKINAFLKQVNCPIVLAAYEWQKDKFPLPEIECFIQKPLFKSKLLKALYDIFNNKKDKHSSFAFEASDYSTKRVLLAEDNDLNREIAQEFLATTNIQIETAKDGKECFDMFKASVPGYYDLIFMDIQMPNMTGYEATQKIRALKRKDAKTLPIVAMTADAFAEDVQKALLCGMNDHLAKPLDVEKLIKVLKKYLGNAD